MADEYVDLVVRVPLDEVRKTQWYWSKFTSEEIPTGLDPDDLHDAAIAAALEFDLPPERVPVTPETPWGTVIARRMAVDAGRRFLAPTSDDRFAFDADDGSASVFSDFYDGWFEVRRP
jgi:hypothetical protein